MKPFIVLAAAKRESKALHDILKASVQLHHQEMDG